MENRRAFHRFPASGGPSPRAQTGGSFRNALVVSFALWAALFLWLGCRSDPFWSGFDYGSGRSDYYNILVDGFLGGHLAMNAAVHPDLLSTDPLVRNRAPYLLDAALYNGKYYLYYGVTPAAVLLYPYSRLTGKHLSPPAACLIFIIAGFGVGVFWLKLLRDRLGAEWKAGFAVAAVSLLASVPGLTFLVRRSSFYDLPVAAAYLWMNVFWVALWHVWNGRHTLRNLILAGASFGLAVGCRANLVLLIPVIAASPWILGRRMQERAGARCAALVVPALMIGVGLGWYNYQRFGSPSDFGFDHGLNSFFATGNPLLSPRFFLSNARAYLLTSPSLASWFPFDFPIDVGTLPKLYSNAEAMNGSLPVTCLAGWLLVVGMVTVATRRAPGTKIAAAWPWLLVFSAAVQLSFIFLLGIRAARYATDFLVPVSFLLILGLAQSWQITGGFGRTARSGAGFLILVGCVHAVLGSVQQFNEFKSARAPEFAGLSSFFNPEQSTMERWGAPHPGGAVVGVRFFCPKTAVTREILTTGLPGAYDSLRAIVFPNGYVEFEIFHSSFGGPRTGLIPVVWDRPYTLKVFMGSLYPAVGDAFFEGWPVAKVKSVKEHAWLEFEGKPVINRRMAFYESSPWPKSIPVSEGPDRALSVDSLELGRPAPKAVIDRGGGVSALYALELALPDPRKTRPVPLLCSGVTGDGDLLYFDPLPNGQYRIGVDEWGIDGFFGAPFSPKVGKLIRVDVVAGPALRYDFELAEIEQAAKAGNLGDRLMVWYDGKLVGDIVIKNHLDTFDYLEVGLNDAGFSSAVGAFPGELRRLELSGEEKADLLQRAILAE